MVTTAFNMLFTDLLIGASNGHCNSAGSSNESRVLASEIYFSNSSNHILPCGIDNFLLVVC